MIRTRASRMSVTMPPDVSPIFTSVNISGEPPTSGCMNGFASTAPCAISVRVSQRIGRAQQQRQDRDREPLRVMPVHRGEAEIVIATGPSPTWREAAMNERPEAFAGVDRDGRDALAPLFCEVCVIQLN